MKPKIIKSKKTDTAEKNQTQETRYVGVLLEKLDDNVRVIAEQYVDIRKTLDSHTEMIGSIKEDVEVMKLTLDSHSEKLDSHTEMIGSIKEDIEVIKLDIEFIKGALKKKVDYEEFIVLEKRISLIEAKLSKI